MFARKGDNWIRLIGLFKLGKGLLFLLVGLAVRGIFWIFDWIMDERMP